MKTLSVLLTLTLLLVARDNPFSDVVTTETFPVSTNIPKVVKDLRKESFRLPNSARVVKRVIIEYQNLDGSVQKQSTDIDKKVDWHMPLVLTHRKSASSADRFTQKVKLPFIKFSTKANKMRVATKDKLLRHFMLPHPHRIVLDFKGSSRFLSKKYTDLSRPFTKIRLGNHHGYYRVVVELDGQYEYQEKSDRSGITLSVR
jgi:hypothetical protein